MICPECGTDFCEKSVNQIYCSPKCGERYRKKHPMEVRFPSVAFYCAKCGKAVVTDGGISGQDSAAKNANEDTGDIHQPNTVHYGQCQND